MHALTCFSNNVCLQGGLVRAMQQEVQLGNGLVTVCSLGSIDFLDAQTT